MKAFVVVDVQNDFAPWGALPVPGGDQVVPVINRLQQQMSLVIATQDWHPKNHSSFASNQGRKPGEIVSINGRDQILWPDHCVQDTKGAAFIPGLNTTAFQRVFRKGVNPDVDSYSGFFDNDRRTETGLGRYLRDRSVTEVFIAGLATDYCVKYTAMDAGRLGFRTHVIEDACRGVELNNGDIDAALSEMTQAGIAIVKSSTPLSQGDCM
jgi:nicotinamidase/pyrazinamidase